jgi:DNA-binding transcriptional ArsR family regulator
MPGDFVTVLSADLRRRLRDLEAETAAINRALRVLEAREPRTDRRDLHAVLIDSIRDSPGSRVSFLALEFGISPETVTAHLRELEQSGAVVKRRLGWEVSRQRG